MRTSKNIKILFITVGFLFVSTLFLIKTSTGVNIRKPDDIENDPLAAQLYEASPYFIEVKNDSSTILATRKDLALFARTTLSQFAENDKPIAFTFTSKPKKTSDTSYSFYGYFYGVDDKINLILTKQNNSTYQLSIINTKTKTNIDEFLSLNGPRNRLIQKLPVEKDFYSIRYQYSEDKIIVSYYLGFSKADIDESVKFIEDTYGKISNTDDFTFSINSVGTFRLSEVYLYLEKEVTKPQG